MDRATWFHRANSYAHRRYGIGLHDLADVTEFDLYEDPIEFIDRIGEKYDLTELSTYAPTAN